MPWTFSSMPCKTFGNALKHKLAAKHAARPLLNIPATNEESSLNWLYRAKERLQDFECLAGKLPSRRHDHGTNLQAQLSASLRYGSWLDRAYSVWAS